MANGVAHALGRRGLARGDRVAILSANRAEYLAAYYGIMRAGLVAVPVNFKFPRATIHFILQDSDAKLLFCDRVRLADCPPAVTDGLFGSSPSPGGGGSASAAIRGGVDLSLPHENSPPPDALRASTSPSRGRYKESAEAVKDEASVLPFDDFLDPGPFDAVVPAQGEPAMFLYTSGSTGTPKGVVLSHQSHIWVVETRLAPGTRPAPLPDRRAALSHERAGALQARLRGARYHRAAAAVHRPRVHRGDRALPLHVAHRRAADDRHDAARERAAGPYRSLQRRVHPHGFGAGEPKLDAGDSRGAAPGFRHQRVWHHRGRTGGVRASPARAAATGDVSRLSAPGRTAPRRRASRRSCRRARACRSRAAGPPCRPEGSLRTRRPAGNP